MFGMMALQPHHDALDISLGGIFHLVEKPYDSQHIEHIGAQHAVVPYAAAHFALAAFQATDIAAHCASNCAAVSVPPDTAATSDFSVSINDGASVMIDSASWIVAGLRSAPII